MVDLRGRVNTFLQHRDVNLANACRPDDVEPPSLRKLLLGALRFGEGPRACMHASTQTRTHATDCASSTHLIECVHTTRLPAPLRPCASAGKPFVLDLGSVDLAVETLNDLLDPVLPGLLPLLLSKQILNEEHYSRLLRPDDGPECAAAPAPTPTPSPPPPPSPTPTHPRRCLRSAQSLRPPRCPPYLRPCLPRMGLGTFGQVRSQAVEGAQPRLLPVCAADDVATAARVVRQQLLHRQGRVVKLLSEFTFQCTHALTVHLVLTYTLIL